MIANPKQKSNTAVDRKYRVFLARRTRGNTRKYKVEPLGTCPVSGFLLCTGLILKVPPCISVFHLVRIRQAFSRVLTVTLMLAMLLPSLAVFSQTAYAATTSIRQEINLIEGYFTAALSAEG